MGLGLLEAGLCAGLEWELTSDMGNDLSAWADIPEHVLIFFIECTQINQLI